MSRFSAGGFPGWDAGFFTAMKALTLPAFALALPQASILARVMRSALLDTLSEDFIRTARAKGLTKRQTLWRHALRNAMIPVLTIIGLQFAFFAGGGDHHRKRILFTRPGPAGISVDHSTRPDRR